MATIVTKNSSTASAVPTTSDLVQGELAVNVTDKRIFTENASTQIVELGTNPSSITTATATVTGTLTANGTFASSNAVITGGSVNSTPIGATTPSTIVGSTVTANTGFVGGLTGNVTGNLTGNVTGNVNGNLTGNVTGNVTASSGTTTLNDLVVNGTADFTNTKLTNITTPTASSDAANKGYVDSTVAAVIDSAPAALDTLNELAAALGDDANFAGTVTTALATKLPLAGGTMTGAIAMGTSKITGLGNPTSAQDAATKTYVDTADALKLNLTGGTMSGAIAMGTNKITGVGNPTLAQDAATKDYVDDILGSATSAATSAAAAATSASNAATSASNAATSATASANSASAAAASYDAFDDRYLGDKASDPTLDNDGNALLTGALYFNTTSDVMKVYDGSAWNIAAISSASPTFTGTVTADGLSLGDNEKATFGAGNDLEIYHDGSNSYIKEGGTGNLRIQADDLYVFNVAGNSVMISALDTGKVGLGYAGAEKLATTSTGIDVTGNITVGTNDSIFAENNLRFKSTGAAYIDHNTVGQDINFRVSGSTSLDTNAMTVSSTGIDVTGTATMDGLTVSGTTDSTEELARFGNSTGTQELIIEQQGTTGYAIKSSSDLRLHADYDNDTSDGGSNIEMYTDGTQRMSITGSTGDISFYEDTGTTPKFFWDASAEALALGTSTSVSNNRLVINQASGDGQNSGFYMQRNGGAGTSFKIDIDSDDVVNFRRSISTAIAISSSGNVGIGTSSPTFSAGGGLNVANATFATMRARGGASTGVDFAQGNDGKGYVYVRDNADLIFGTNNTERMRIDSSGNVGIGTSSPAWGIQTGNFRGSASAPVFSGTSGDGFAFDYYNGPNPYPRRGSIAVIGAGTATADMSFWTDSGSAVAERMRIDSSGNVGIGVVPEAWNSAFPSVLQVGAAASLTTSGGDNARLFGNVWYDGTNYKRITSGYAHQYEQGGGTHRWYNAGTGAADSNITFTQAMTLDSSGNLLVGRTSTITFSTNTTDGIVLSPSRIDISAASLCRISQLRDSTGTYDRFYNGASIVGSITGTTSATAYNTSSDQRLKENIADADDAGSKVDAIQVRQFDWKSDGSHQKYGMVAQELIEVAPEAVSVPEDPEEMMGVDYSKLVPMLIKEIQSLRNRVATLEGN